MRWPVRCGLVFLLLVAPGQLRADLREIQQSGVLRVLVAADELPEVFSFETASGLPGLEREAIEAFTRTQKLRLEVTAVTKFDQIIPRLLQGEGDVILGIVDTPQRRQRVAFTSELLPVRHVVVTRQPTAPLEQVERLRLLRVAVVSGTSWADAAARAGVPPDRLVLFGGTQELLGGLRAGAAAAAVMTVLEYALAQKQDPAIQAGVLLGEPSRACWAVRPTDPELRRTLSAHLDALKASGAWSRIALKYLSPDCLQLIARARRSQP